MRGLYFLVGCLWCAVSLVRTAPLPRRMVDMTHTLDETTHTMRLPGMKKFQMNVIRNGTEEDGIWIQFEEYSSVIHIGTHMDAPSHFSEGGVTVDQIPLSQLVAPAAVVDTSARAALDPEDRTTVADLLLWESVTGKSLNGTILLLRTGWGKKWDDAKEFLGAEEEDPDTSKFKWPSIALETAQWLVDNRAVHGIGVETINFDKAMDNTFPAHQIILGHGMFAIENVANMDQLPIYGAELHVLPMKIGKASGAQVRMMATFPEVIYDWHSTEARQSSVDCHII